MTNKNVKLKNRSGDYLYPYTDNIPAASSSTAGKVKLDTTPTSGSNNAITSGAVFTALNSIASDLTVAHKAGDETFTGTKTLQVGNDDAWLIKKANGDYTVASPEAQVAGAYRVVDKNGKIIGDVRFTRQTSGSQISQLLARNAVTGSEVSCYISCIVDKDGNAYTSAPTPATSDNSTKIATTAYVKSNLSGYVTPSNLATVQVVVETYVNDTSWYRIWSNGWIEQGGQFTNTNSTFSVNLLKTMSNTNYSVLVTLGENNKNSSYSINAGEKTTTSFTGAMSSSNTTYKSCWYACGY